MFPVFPVADMTLTGIGAPFTFATAVGVILAGIAGLILTLVLDNWWSRRQPEEKTAMAVEELGTSRKAA